MDRPRALVLTAAGINCDHELAEAFELGGAQAESVHLNRLADDPAIVDGFDLIGLPGGFSYGDAVAAGRILAVMLRSSILERLHAAVARGVPMIAPCNGFQIAVQAGLLPGPREGQPASIEVGLLDNAGGRFVDRWVRMEYPESRCVWTRGMNTSSETRILPIAHGEGRFHASAEVMDRLDRGGQIAVRYAPEDDPNGSLGHVAGICDETGLVLGLMPHPERYVHWSQHPCWTRLNAEDRQGDAPGLTCFRNAVNHVVQTRQTAGV